MYGLDRNEDVGSTCIGFAANIDRERKIPREAEVLSQRIYLSMRHYPCSKDSLRWCVVLHITLILDYIHSIRPHLEASHFIISSRTSAASRAMDQPPNFIFIFCHRDSFFST